MGIKKLIEQQNLKQKKDIAPNSKAFRSWFLRKVIDNDKNNSLNIWIVNNLKIWGTHLNRREVVMYSISHFGHSKVSQIREIFDSFVNRWTLTQGNLNEWDIHKDVL